MSTRSGAVSIFCTCLALALWAAIALSHKPAARPNAVASPSPNHTLTYADDIAPIVDDNCIGCHHSGSIAPFSLTDYASVRDRAQVIVAVTKSRYMPPWKAEIGYGDFTGVRHLTDEQLAELSSWANQGTLEGSSADIPRPQTFPGGWTLRKPDVIYSMEHSFPVSSDGSDVYRCFVFPTHFPTDKYLSAFEVRPGNARVVHHVIAYIDTTGAARKLAAVSGGYGYTSFGGPGFPPAGLLGGWVPGNTPARFPDGLGILLPKGADIVLQVHYHSDGKSETDLSRIGLYFTDKPVDKLVRPWAILHPALYIPPGDPDYQVKTSQLIPFGITLRQILPHMHLLGRRMEVKAVTPAGATIPLLKIDNWDFNWQTTYTYKTPVEIPAGSRICVTADYDNSIDNPRNPNNPPKLVTWGEQTTDEMCVVFLIYTVDAEHLNTSKVSSAGIDPGGA